MLLVAACVLGVVFSMAAYYDTNLRSGLENKAKTTTNFFIYNTSEKRTAKTVLFKIIIQDLQ